MSAQVDHRSLYRLPWNLADNAITWLEPTTKCNLYCEGCYRENDPQGHKPLEVVIEELETVKRLRKTDGISIAGGEPLIYPHIVELVRYVADQGWKPIVNSNGRALTPELVGRLLDAGIAGFTFHVDSHQNRPGWKGKTEQDLNELRLRLARMVYKHGRGRIAVAFNATVYRDTLGEVPGLVQWAQEHIEFVNTMVFILFRSAKKKASYDGWVHGKKIDIGGLVYHLEHQEGHQDIMSQEVIDQIRTVFPEYQPSGYLNGTEDASAFKWLLGLRFGNPKKMFGCTDAQFIELAQIAHHATRGTYLAYTSPRLMRKAGVIMPLAVVNKSVGQIARNYLTSPANWGEPLRMQSLMIIQPCDIMPDGRQSMCDGCPDILPYKGRLVWSCRVDELDKLGGFVSFGPKEPVTAQE